MDVDQVVQEIRAVEEQRQADAAELCEQVGDVSLDGALEDSILHAVTGDLPEEFTAAGVDGGLARKALHGLDLILHRAVAAQFHYRDGELDDAAYLPERTPSPDVECVTRNADRQEVDRRATLLRLDAEVSAAQEAVPGSDLVMLDGSLLPRPGDRPDGEGPLAERYEDVRDGYRELYRRAEEHGTSVAGIVEDSRSSRLCTVLEEHGVPPELVADGRDTVILTYLLDPGERTLVTPYSDDGHPVVTDMDLEDHFYVFYLRSVEKDRPVRVEFYAPDSPVQRAEELAARLLALCGEGSSYGIPPVLIEADQRAKLGGNEVDLLTKRVAAKLAHLPGVGDLRRERRPF